MKRAIIILSAFLTMLFAASCSPAEIRQAKVMTQAEIDEYNNKIHPGGDDTEEPGDTEDPGNPGNPDTPVVPEVQKVYYVSVGGAGEKTGVDAANAIDLGGFRSLVRDNADASKLSGVTVHFAAGTYILGDSNHPGGLEIAFGSSLTKVKLSLEGVDGTIFSGDSKYRILHAGAKLDLSVKGITFSNGYTTGHGGAIYAEGCSLNMENCTISMNKSATGTSNNENNGGAIYLHKDLISASFKDCVFDKNRISENGGNQFGGAVRIEAASSANEVSFDGCVFTGNYAKQGACINVNALTRLNINNCLFKGNSAESRGMIQVANGVVFINGSTFYGNTTTINNGWGVDIHGKAYLCLNNCTIYGNSNSSTTDGNNNAAINGYHSMLMTNCTVIESCQLGLMRIDDAAGKQVLCNNILINTSGKTTLVGNTDAATVTLGHNAMSPVTGFTAFTAAASDLVNCTETSFGSHSYNEASRAYTWNGTLDGFTPASQDDVEAAMLENFDLSISNLISNIGQAFHDWLEDMNPAGYTTDGRGVARAGSWWPGAYQN